jgi:hypothetical protein
MIKTLSSVTLLLVASGWLSILPAETLQYTCIYCYHDFSSKAQESQKCPQNIKPGKPSTNGPHKFRGMGKEKN